jgi:hypothetical protein
MKIGLDITEMIELAEKELLKKSFLAIFRYLKEKLNVLRKEREDMEKPRKFLEMEVYTI